MTDVVAPAGCLLGSQCFKRILLCCGHGDVPFLMLSTHQVNIPF